MELKMAHIYCDGACLGNPGTGGWAVIIVRDDGTEEVQTGSEPNTTNNIMELTGALVGLNHTSGPATIVSDAKYLVHGASLWVPKWRVNGWRTKQKHAVKNYDLWLALDEHIKARPLVWQWVKGHSGHRYNERADALANAAADAEQCKNRPFWARPRLVRK